MNKPIEEQISGFIHDAQASLKAAYCKGYATAKKEITAEAQESEYKRGLNDAEKAIKRVLNAPSQGGLYANEMQEIFGTKGIVTVLLTHSVSEIIEKIREYDDKKAEKNASPDNEIHVGDEVYYMHDKNVKKIVLGITDFGNFAVLSQNGNFGVFSKCELHKTGRNYPIMEILKKLNQLNESEE